MLLRAALAAAAVAGTTASFWVADGGSPQRTSSAVLDTDITAVQPHRTVTFSSNIEDTISEVEGYLLQSPLVTSGGIVVVASDDCTVSLLGEPAGVAPGAAWNIRGGGFGSTFKWRAPQGVPGAVAECVMSGIALDTQSGIYMLDGRNEILYKLAYTMQQGFGPSPVVWNASFKPNPLKFELDVSMLFIPGTDPISNPGIVWVPIAASLLGQSGIAIAVNPTDGSFTFVPRPDSDCSPGDFGSAALMGQDIALLGNTKCGLVIVDGSASPPKMGFQTYPDWGQLLFDLGEHSHPIFDAGTNQLYFFDWASNMLIRQQLCCINLINYAECGGWETACTRIPEIDSYEGREGTYFDRWEWLGGALSGNFLYIAASGPLHDEVILGSDGDLMSSLFVWDVTTQTLVATHSFTNDMFNSAPLAITGNTGDTRVYVMTTLGNLYCYAGGAAAGNGPVWVSADVAPIPDEDLPQTTYSFLSLTPSGSILVTASAGGADWADEKVYYGIINGVYAPSAPPAPGPNTGTAAVIAVLVVGLLGAGAGYFAYGRSPAFAGMVDRGTAAAKSAAEDLAARASSLFDGSGGRGGLMSGGGGGGSAAKERTSLLATAYGSTSAGSGGSSGEPSAPAFGGTSFNSASTSL